MDLLSFDLLTEIADRLSFIDFISFIQTNKKNNELKNYTIRYIRHFENEFKRQPYDLLSSYTSKCGHLDSVKYLHFDDRKFSVRAMDWASKSGHLEVVIWLHENRAEGCTIDAMDWAAGEGHFDVVKWLHKNRKEGFSMRGLSDAHSNGYIEIVKFLIENPIKVGK